MLKKLYPIFLILSFFVLSCEEDNPTPPINEPPQIEYFSVNSTTVYKGDVVKFSWSVKNSESVSIDQNIGAVQASGSKDVIMEEIGRTTFTLTAINSGGSKTATVTVTVNVKISLLWENRFEYDDGSEWPETTGPQIDDMIMLSDGGFALVGNVYNYCNGYHHPILVRFDNQGRVLWWHLYDKLDSVFFDSIVDTPDYGFFIVGRKGYWKKYEHQWAFHFLKASGQGKVLWQRDNYDYFSYAKDCVVSDDGDYIIVGSVYNSEVYLGKFKEEVPIWQKTFKSNELNTKVFGEKILKTFDGGYAILGLWGEGISKWSGVPSNIYLIKTDKKGNLMWDKIIAESTSIESKPSDFIQTKDGGYLIAGNFHEAAGDTWNWGAYIAKTDSTGNIEWEKRFACKESDYWQEITRSITSCSDGNFLIIGNTKDSSDSDSLSEIYLAKIDGSGELIWQTNFSPDHNKSRKGIWAVETGSNEFIILAQEDSGTLCFEHTNVWLFKIRIER